MDRRRRAPVGRKKVIAEDPLTSGDQPKQSPKSSGNNGTSSAATSPRRFVNGSSKESVISQGGTQTPIRSSKRPLRPSAKKAASTELDNGSSDSNPTPPASITPKSRKKRKAPGRKLPKPEVEKSTPRNLIVSLGTLEISDSDDMLSASPSKRQKVDRKAIDNIINLCSDDDSGAPAVTLNEEKDVIVLSGDEADCIPDRPPLVCNADPEPAGMDKEIKSRNSTPKSNSDSQGISLTQDVFNSLCEEPLKQTPAAFAGCGRTPAFLLSSPVAIHDVSSCEDAYIKEHATPGLLTTRFFARAMSAITASRSMGTHDLGIGQTLSAFGVSEAAGAEDQLANVSVSPGSEKVPSLEGARVKNTQSPIGVGEVSDVSNSKSADDLSAPALLLSSAAIEVAGSSEEITKTVVGHGSSNDFQLEATNQEPPPVDVELPESTPQEAADHASPDRTADSFEHLFYDSNASGDIEMRPVDPSDSFSDSPGIDVPLSAPDLEEAEISSTLVVEEPVRKDLIDTSPESSADISGTDCDASSQSQPIHIHLIDPSIFENPKVHILLNCLKGVIADQDKLTSLDLGYPDLSHTEEMVC